MTPYKHILITGGAGFVGSSLALFLKEDYPDMQITVLDNLKRSGSELNLPRLKHVGITFQHGDIRIPADLDAVTPFDLLLECSAEPSAFAGFDNSPLYLLHTNLTGTLHCLEAARRFKAATLFLSSSRVYPIPSLSRIPWREDPTRFSCPEAFTATGFSTQGVAEDFPLEGHRTLYGTTKLASELVLQEYARMYDLPALILRSGVLSGPWQMGKVDQGFLVLWLARHFFKSSLVYRGFGGTGKQVRDILHVQDLYRCITLLWDKLPTFRGEIFNIGGGMDNSISLQELTQMCQEVTGNTISIGSDPETHPGDIPYFVTNNRRVQEICGWKPNCNLNTLAGEIFHWLKDHEKSLRPLLAG